ncbi:MAG TPA: DUF4082 domain-containing protein, partial [Nitrospiria bacterium]|nr:DUF4082 domain-containing protein [Nitrospiria bacterium]
MLNHKATATGWLLAMAQAMAYVIVCGMAPPSAQGQTFACSPPAANPIVCENSKSGNPSSEWDIVGAGDPSLQGFATDISVNQGQTVHFKIETDAAAYHLDIYRMGYYNGMGARKITTVVPSVPLPQTQPDCLSDITTGLLDCGNWAESASWAVPPDAVSGIYFAKLVREDTGGASHIVFIVRADAGGSDLLFKTSDTTWQAYNSYGGSSLYDGPNGRAYKVSYNRPFNDRGNTGGPSSTWVFSAEYPMVRWLESNGYNVSYFTSMDSDRYGTKILEHKTFLSVGHDEYWSGAERANVEAARAAGVHLAFFSGNEVFWKTRWENSIDGTNTSYRTLVCYKETLAGQPIDPADPPTWTGTWRDPRFSPPADGGRPENALTGTLFRVNGPRNDAIEVPAIYGKMRFWRHTNIAALSPNTTATLPDGTLGYEWDEAPDNGVGPAGLIKLSSVAINISTTVLLDYGATYGTGTATHSLTLYRSASGALVFGAGTIQWSWGLDSTHDNGNSPPDVNMQQATVNLFADMGVQPATLQSGLIPATASTDVIAPTSIVSSPTPGSSPVLGYPVTITGTATDAGGGVVGGVEVSVDGGATWHQAFGLENWSYSWTPGVLGTVTLMSRAVDDSGNLEVPSSGVAVNVVPGTIPYSLWTNAAVPQVASAGDTKAVEVGVKFSSDVSGYITGLRFYKGSANTGTHTGHLWTGTGTLLAGVVFTNETPLGWQQVSFSAPVPITANTVYVASYHTDAGAYAVDQNYFASSGYDNPPLHALANGINGANGVYAYGPSSFPTQTYASSNYWVDVVFAITASDTIPPNLSAVQATGITINGALITWSSDEPASSQVEYGTTNDENEISYTSATLVDPSLVTGHTVSLSGLAPSTLYHYRVKSMDNSGNLATSGDFTFTTATPDTTPPALGAIQATALTRSEAVILWSSDEPADSQVEYGTTTAYGSATPLDPTLVTSHIVSLSGLAPSTLYHYRVKSKDGSGNPAASADYTFTTTANLSLWTDATVPAVASQGDTSSVELGFKFRSDVSGYIVGLRFYKGSANTGTHIGNLWTAAGTPLASAAFTNETASGWQQVFFSSPVAITANTVYVASYHANVGGYSVTRNYFVSGYDNAPLHALADGASGSDGVYLYGAGGFPTQTNASTNYWVDVVFSASDQIPPVLSAVQATGVTSRKATVTWSSDEPADSQVEYGTTTAYGNAAALNSTLVTSHTVSMNGLAASTLYHFRVKSRDASINLAASADFTFTTAPPDLTPPGLSAIQATGVTGSEAMILWSTDEPADSQVEYGTTTAYGNSTPLNSTLVTSHMILLSGLAANTLYHYHVESRDDSGNLAVSSDFTFTTTDAVSLWTSATVPAVASQGDTKAVEVGVKFRSDVSGYIVGLRFYKGGANTGTHTGHLWTSSGTLMASAIFINETASGWQQVFFSAPVPIIANTVYVASYHSDVGGYSVNQNYFASSGYDNPPLHALANGINGGNGVYAYGSAFPTQTYLSTNYWMDILFSVSGVDTVPPTLSGVQATGITTGGATILWSTDEPADSQVEYGTTTAYGSVTPLNATLVASHTISISGLAGSTLYHFHVKSKDSSGNPAVSADFTFTTATPDTTAPVLSAIQATAITRSGATILWSSDEPADSQVEYGTTTSYGSTTTLDPTLATSHTVSLSGLAASTLYHYRVKSRDGSGNPAVSADFTFTTTTVYSLWTNATLPAVASQGDTKAVEVGVKFRSDVSGYIVGLRFYKGGANTGTHIGNLWTSTGTLLASATFTGETASGWQQVFFSSPVPITANTVYVASYHTNVGGYSVTRNYFASGYNNAPLHALADGANGGDGVYLYGAGG